MVCTHIGCPTHSIREWDGQMGKDATLAPLGLVIDLGHRGLACPQASSIVELWIGDMWGFCPVNVRFCQCSSLYKTRRGLQLIELGIFPCSDKPPQSGFTIMLLLHFGIFGTLGKGSAHKYYPILERLSQTGFPGNLPD